MIGSQEWTALEKGLKQRIKALNLFTHDIYRDGKIIKDKVIPPEIVYGSEGYLKESEGLNPINKTWLHISGTDLIRDSLGEFHVLEDNLRCPSGVSYVLENREVMKRIFPELFETLMIRPVYNYPIHLKSMLSQLSEKERPNIVVLTPGSFNSAYYEHSLLAQEMGVSLVEGSDLVCQDEKVYMKTTSGLKVVDVIYRRIDDAFLDPEIFNPESVLGVKGLFEAYTKGNVALANAPGAGVADDKALYAYVPQIIKYYLGEDALLPNIETFLCSNEKDCKYVLENMKDLVVKATNGSGGYGIMIGPKASQEEKDKFRSMIQENPKKYIAQPVISLSRVPTWVEDSIEGRHVDLRPFILHEKDDIYVLPGGLTRVALKKGSLVVNSSQGGGTKDTWVIGDTNNVK